MAKPVVYGKHCQGRPDKGIENRSGDKQANETGQDDNNDADPTDTHFPDVNRNLLCPTQSEHDQTERSDKIHVVRWNDGQAPVVLGPLVAKQVRRPPPRGRHAGPARSNSVKTRKADHLKRNVRQPHQQAPARRLTPFT